MGIHQELDEMITRSGYSVPQIAQATGISDKSIYAYRKGRKIPEAKRAILLEYLRTSERVRVVMDARARARREKAAAEASRKDAETEARLRRKHLEKRAERGAIEQERVLRHGGRVTLATEDGKPVHLVMDQDGDLEVRYGQNGECEVSATRHLMKAGAELGVMVDDDGALFIPDDSPLMRSRGLSQHNRGYLAAPDGSFLLIVAQPSRLDRLLVWALAGSGLLWVFSKVAGKTG